MSQWNKEGNQMRYSLREVLDLYPFSLKLCEKFVEEFRLKLAFIIFKGTKICFCFGISWKIKHIFKDNFLALKSVVIESRGLNVYIAYPSKQTNIYWQTRSVFFFPSRRFSTRCTSTSLVFISSRPMTFSSYRGASLGHSCSERQNSSP